MAVLEKPVFGLGEIPVLLFLPSEGSSWKSETELHCSAAEQPLLNLKASVAARYHHLRWIAQCISLCCTNTPFCFDCTSCSVSMLAFTGRILRCLVGVYTFWWKKDQIFSDPKLCAKTRFCFELPDIDCWLKCRLYSRHKSSWIKIWTKMFYIYLYIYKYLFNILI